MLCPGCSPVTTPAPSPAPVHRNDVIGWLPNWRGAALTLAGTLVLSEGMTRWVHLEGGALLGLGALAGGWWLLSRRRLPLTARLPGDLQGWIDRCRGVLPQFERLAGDDGVLGRQRAQALESLLIDLERPELAAGLVGCRPPAAALQRPVAQALRGRLPLRLHWGEALPASCGGWCWPTVFVQADVLLYHLHWPLSAADLRWLEALPQGQPVWLLLQLEQELEPLQLRRELGHQWPGLVAERCLIWNGQEASLTGSLAPLAAWLRQGAAGQRQRTALRLLEQLHRSWQAELETLRRQRWQQLQQRTQWLVAAGVLASPLPSLDLLLLAVANGLMLQEMAQLWDCPWQLDSLRAAAAELTRAALALGLVEWSGQALLAAARLHGATWLVGGALQALSAAYLTRVVGHAMADVLALSSGVTEMDLAEIRRRAPVLVARAAEAERIDWNGFLLQARQWLGQQGSRPAISG
jgi:hypothetical protein